MKRALPLLVISLAVLSPAQISKKGNAYLMRTKYATGQKMKYVMNNVANVPGMQQGMKMSSPILMDVKSVKNGVATIDVTTGPAMLNGKSQGDTDKRMVKLDNRNKPVGGQSNFEGFSSFEFPALPVAPGASWKGKTKLDTPMGGIQLNATYKFIGVKTVNGKAVAEIRSTFSGAMMGPITGSSTTLLLLSDGSLYSADAKTTTEIKMSADAKPTKISATITVKRQ
jgi:hypothetical protein